MALRFRKRIKIAPGVNLNLGKRGASASIGKRGASVNVGGKGGPKATVGIPGSGLSHTSQLGNSSRDSRAQRKGIGLGGLLGYGLLGLFALLVVIGFLSG